MKIILLVCFLCLSKNLFAEDLSSTPKFLDYRIELAKALREVDDLCSSLKIYNEIILEKECGKNFDEIYVNCLRDTMSIYLLWDTAKGYQIFQKLKIYDKQNMPVSRVENGCFILENLPDEMVSENQSWIYEIIRGFGMKIDKEDIIFKDNSITVKMPTCCCGCFNEFQNQRHSD